MKDVKCVVPNIEDIFTALSGGIYFSKLDLRNAYNQIEVDDASQLLLSWSTLKGVYACKRMSFGAKTACAIFQNTMTKVLQGAPGCICFHDDILVTGRTREEHLKNLNIVFQRLLAAGFKLNLEKCEFFKQKVRYLGHIIDSNGLRKDDDKVKAIVDAPQPSNVTEVRAFVGLVNYYARFFPNMSQVLSPIYNLLKKSTTFNWNSACVNSFNLVKKIIASENVLAHYDQKLPLILMCDASQNGIGAAIFHTMKNNENKPIAFASKTLTVAQRNYSTIDREALAIYFGVNKFQQYLMGRNFTLLTDHKPLATIFGNKRGIPTTAASRLQRWATYLSSFDFTIKYIDGKSNVNADFLSRLPLKQSDFIEDDEEDITLYVNFIEKFTSINQDAIRHASAKDSTISSIIKFVKTGWPSRKFITEELKPFESRASELNVEKDILMWGYRVIIPFSLRDDFLRELHSSHMGTTKMKSKARSHFWWPNLDRRIEAIANNCHECIQARPFPAKVQHSPWPKSSFAFHRIHIDFLGPLAHKTFLIVLDSYSKWVEVFPMTTITSSETIEKLRECFARFGLPKTIVSDNGRQLTSTEFENFCSKNGIEHLTTAPYHPQSNGAAENAVKSFKIGMKKALADPKNTKVSPETLANRYLFNYRSAIHPTTTETPFKLMFGRDMKAHFDQITPQKLIEMCDSTMATTTSANANQNSKTIRNFTVNDKVLVRDFQSKSNPWKKAIVKAILGKRMYKCKTVEGEWQRHADQMMHDSSVNSPTELIQNDFSIYSDRFSINRTQDNDVEPHVPSNDEHSVETATTNIGPDDLRSGPQRIPKPIQERRHSTRECKPPQRYHY